MPLNLAGLETPVTLRTATPLSDEELMRFSEESKPYKVERTRDGDISIMTPVGGIGSTHELHVASALFNWSQKSGTGVAIGTNAGFNLPDGSCLAPDAAWISNASWEKLTPEQQAGYPPICPEFIVEVRSRTDSRKLLEAKMQLWLDNGAQLAWLVDPIEANVTVFRRGGEVSTSARPDEINGEAPIESFVLSCSRLWRSSAS